MSQDQEALGVVSFSGPFFQEAPPTSPDQRVHGVTPRSQDRFTAVSLEAPTMHTCALSQLVLTPTITILTSPSLSPARAPLGRRTLDHTSSHPVTISKGGSSISSFSFSGFSRSSRSSPFCEAGAEASAASSFWAMDGLWLGSH